MLRKYAHAVVLGVDYDFVGLTKTAHRHDFKYKPRKGFVYIRSRAISSRTNDNYDTFPAEELRKAWGTFIGKPVFVNHNNDDVKRMRGVIIDAALHDDKAPDGTDDTWVEVLMEIDARRFPLLAMALINHEIERTSMGTDVLVSMCSYCGNTAKTPDQYCAHVKRMKGQRLRRKNATTGEVEDVLVHEVCSGLSFFENSLLVEEPADPTAFAYGLDVRGILEEDEFMDKLSKAASFKPAVLFARSPEEIAIENHWRIQHGLMPLEEDELPAMWSKTAEITATGICGRCHETKTLVGAGAICQDCLTDIQAGGPMRLDASKTACNVLVDDIDANDRFTMDRPGVLRQEVGGMSLVQFADGAQRMFPSQDLTFTDAFFGGRVAASDGPSHSKPGGQPLNRGDRSFTIKRVGKDYEIWDQATDVQLGVVWRGRNVWHGQAMDGTYVVEDYPGSLQVACANVANYRGGTVARKTAAVELDELQRGRFEGTSVDKDEDGFYCKTHRTRSDSYPSIDDIPDTAIEFIESTGAKMKTAEKPSKHAENNLRDAWRNQEWNRISDLADTGWDGYDVAGMAALLGVPVADVEAAVVNGNVIRDEFRAKQDQRWRDRGFVPDESRPGNWRRAAIDLGVPTEVRVPPEVETLRAPQCPVCDSDASWNSDGRCGVCGYLPPPKPFRAPDTDVAGRADQSGGWFDPELTRASPFKLDPAVSVNSNPVQSTSSTAKGQRLTQGVPMEQSVASAARKRIVADRALATENASLREEVARLKKGKTADIDNPAQPVASPAPEAATPVGDADATIDVENVGGVVAPPDLSVPGDVTTPGQELPATEADSKDVEAPVAGGNEPEDSTEEVKADHSAETLGENAFGGDWINPGGGTIGPTASASQRAVLGKAIAQSRDRIFASIRLARLRIQSGIAGGVNDDLSLGQEIEKSATTLEAIQAEASGLQAALRARPAQQQQNRTARRAPSLAAGSQPQMVGLAQRGDDEALFE